MSISVPRSPARTARRRDTDPTAQGHTPGVPRAPDPASHLAAGLARRASRPGSAATRRRARREVGTPIRAGSVSDRCGAVAPSLTLRTPIRAARVSKQSVVQVRAARVSKRCGAGNRSLTVAALIRVAALIARGRQRDARQLALEVVGELGAMAGDPSVLYAIHSPEPRSGQEDSVKFLRTHGLFVLARSAPSPYDAAVHDAQGEASRLRGSLHVEMVWR